MFLYNNILFPLERYGVGNSGFIFALRWLILISYKTYDAILWIFYDTRYHVLSRCEYVFLIELIIQRLLNTHYNQAGQQI